MIYPNEVRDFFKFSFVRNPFSRAASLYCEIMKYRKDLRDFLIFHKDSSFKKFLNLIKKNHHTHWMPMVNFFSINNLDFLGRFEDYKNDLDKLGKKINVEFLNKNFSDNLNFSKKINYLNFYKDKDRNIWTDIAGLLACHRSKKLGCENLIFEMVDFDYPGYSFDLRK